MIRYLQTTLVALALCLCAPNSCNAQGGGPERMAFGGHLGSVNAVAFSRDGKTLFTASSDTSIKLWDAETLKLKETLLTRTGSVTVLAVSPDGKILAAGVVRFDKQLDRSFWEIWVWNLNTLELTSTLKPGQQDKDSFDVQSAINSLAFSPDGKVLASTAEFQARLWEMPTGKAIAKLKPGEQGPNDDPRPTSTSFSPDGKILALGVGTYGKRGVQLWDLETRKLKTTLETHEYHVASVAFSPDGKLIASGESIEEREFSKGRITVWDAHTSKEKWKLTGHVGGVMSVTFSPDGKTLASGGLDKLVALWDLDTGNRRITGAGHSAPVWSVAFSPDGKTLASAGGKRYERYMPPGEIKMWSVPQRD